MLSVLIYITASGDEEAAVIARTLVEERLCACANVIGPVRSFYRWDGKVQDGREVVVMAKTGADRVAAVSERVKALHSYDLPCVVALPIEGGNADFLDWVVKETRPGEGGV